MLKGMLIMEELWKTIEEFDKRYEISSLGNFRNKKTSKTLKQFINTHGYKTIPITFNKKRYNILVHRYVALYFVSNENCKPLVNHIDGNKQNNNANNLEWVTYSENIIHAYKNNLRTHHLDNAIRRGVEHYRSKLSEEDVIKIRKLHETGVGYRKIAKILELPLGAVKSVVYRKSWKHLK